MVYNCHLKIMKKLFYSFIMLVAMSLTFVACEKEPEQPEVKSNCDFFAAQYSVDETGKAMYVFEFATNGLDIENAKGTGDYFVLMMYAQPSADGFPTAKTYNLVSFEELANMEDWEECMIGAMPVSETQIIGTFTYIIEEDKATDILLGIDGNVTFEGNTEKGIIKAVVEFESGVNGDIVTKEYIYNGATKLTEEKSYVAPKKAFKLNK